MLAVPLFVCRPNYVGPLAVSRFHTGRVFRCCALTLFGEARCFILYPFEATRQKPESRGFPCV